MRNRTWMTCIGLTLGASLYALAPLAAAQPTFGNPSPTAGSPPRHCAPLRRPRPACRSCKSNAMR